MELKKELYAKWLMPEDDYFNDQSYVLIRKCVLTKVENSKILSIVVLDINDFNDAFINKIKEKNINDDCVLNLYVPHTVKDKAESSLSEVSINVKITSFVKFECENNEFIIHDKMRIINVDDSKVVLKFLKSLGDMINSVEIIEQISNSTDAAKKIISLKPDAVTMDVQMPNKNGVQVVKEVISATYIPIVMVTSLSIEAGGYVFEALNNGAFDYIQKPDMHDKEGFKLDLVDKLFLAVEKGHQSYLLNQSRLDVVKKYKNKEISYIDKTIWCIGSSTGGTQALTQVLTALPGKIPPIIIIQHMPVNFTKSFADNLNELCPFDVKEIEDQDKILPNNVYIAKGGIQVEVISKGNDLVCYFKDDEPVNRFKPSVDYTFNSLAKIQGYNFVAGILTGMGNDGAKGLLSMKNAGAKTFTQDEESSVVYGMPRVAFELGGSDKVVSLYDISAHLVDSSKVK